MLLARPSKSGYERLNKLSTYDTDFTPYQGVWVSTDPRLVSSAHSGQRIALDAPPINGKLQPHDIPRDRPGYKDIYNGYPEIGGGQIRYYIDKELAEPFINPLFIKPEVVRRENYVDPMGSCKPHYYRASLDTKNCLNWIRDSQFHREDLMSKQLWRRNQTSYETNRAFPEPPMTKLGNS